MDINAKISRLHQDYKADMDAARVAERKGNLEGARRLYRQAARDLCEMAMLESGETKRERTLHAEQILKKAESLGKVPAVPLAGEPRAPGRPVLEHRRGRREPVEERGDSGHHL